MKAIVAKNFYLQTQAPAGNWVDSIGATKDECERMGRYMKRHAGAKVRVVERIDRIVWNPQAE
jgi:hypothetical protein